MPNRSNESLNENERKSLVQEIKTRIKFIITDSEILLNNGGQLLIVAALYIHAVEEYGKYLYVKNLPAQAGIVTVEMNNKFLKHDYKINLAKNDLPAACFALNQGGFSKSGFSASGFQVQQVPDWDTRLTIFNTDIENGRVKHLPQVDAGVLKKAIKKFKEIIPNYDFTGV